MEIIKGDITTLAVDAIVNAANNAMMGGGGVDGAIHRAAGPALKEACRLHRGCETGAAKMTAGYNLPAKFVIHAVGPVWYNGTRNEAELLASTYQSSLEIAAAEQMDTIAFPSISTGAYRFPFDQATTIAINTIRSFLAQNAYPKNVMLVAFSAKDFRQMEKIKQTIDQKK